MKITNEVFDSMADMLKISFTSEEKTKLIKDLNQMVDFIDTMNELDTDEVEPMTYIHNLKNVYREDIATDTGANEELHANAEDFVDGYYVVPRILD
jgi:aspartyl-tRNA(Asn)/glutamyl-tRNA(Gln) amidotransferase subunit C